MTWAILGPYLIALVLIAGIGNLAVTIYINPYYEWEKKLANKWHARISLAAIA